MKKYALFLAAACLIFPLTAYSADTGIKAENRMFMAALYMEIGDLNRALTEINGALESAPAPGLYCDRGLIHYSMRNYSKAVEDYTAALSSSASEDVYFRRALAFCGTGDFTKAVNDFTRSIELKPGRLQVYYDRGYALYMLGKYAEAVKDFTLVLEKQPDYYKAYLLRGKAYSMQGNSKMCLNDLTKALDKNSGVKAEAYLFRGKLMAKEGKNRNAIKDFTSALELEPGIRETYYERGMAYQKIGNEQKAILNLTKAIELDVQYEDAYFQRAYVYLANKLPTVACTDAYRAGMLYLKEGKREQAVKCLDFMRSAIPGWPLSLELADAIENMKLYVIEDKSGADIGDIEPAPDDAVDYYNKLKQSYGSSPEMGRIIAKFTKAIEADKRDAGAYYDRGIAYYITGKYKESIEDFSNSILMNSGNANVYLWRGAAFLKSGDIDKAVEELTVLIDKDKTNTIAYYQRALAYRARGSLTLACNNYYEAAKLYLKENGLHMAEKILRVLKETDLRSPLISELEREIREYKLMESGDNILKGGE